MGHHLPPTAKQRLKKKDDAFYAAIAAAKTEGRSFLTEYLQRLHDAVASSARSQATGQPSKRVAGLPGQGVNPHNMAQAQFYCGACNRTCSSYVRAWRA